MKSFVPGTVVGKVALSEDSKDEALRKFQREVDTALERFREGEKRLYLVLAVDSPPYELSP